MLKDFSFIVKCNDKPSMRINVVAENVDKAQAYVKNMYASHHATYANDKYNNWSIKEV